MFWAWKSLLKLSTKNWTSYHCPWKQFASLGPALWINNFSQAMFPVMTLCLYIVIQGPWCFLASLHTCQLSWHTPSKWVQCRVKFPIPSNETYEQCVLPTAFTELQTKPNSRKRRDYFTVLLHPGGFASSYLRKEMHNSWALWTNFFWSWAILCLWYLQGAFSKQILMSI